MGDSDLIELLNGIDIGKRQSATTEEMSCYSDRSVFLDETGQPTDKWVKTNMTWFNYILFDNSTTMIDF